MQISFCVQETKMQEGQADIAIEGYYHYLNSAVKKAIVEHLFIPKGNQYMFFME